MSMNAGVDVVSPPQTRQAAVPQTDVSLRARRARYESVIEAAAVLVFACLAANRFAPNNMNADFLINSVMSLQRVTLFYWGQGRLANVLPAIAWAIRNPTANLGVILFLTVIVHFWLLLMAARMAVRLIWSDHRPFSDLAVFVSLSALVLWVMPPFASYSMIVQHPEYSFSTLLFAFSFQFAFFGVGRLRWLAVALCVFVAVGINFAVIFLLGAAATVTAMYRLRTRGALDLPTVIPYLFVSALSFVVWTFWSRRYDPNPNGFKVYSNFDPAFLRQSWRIVIQNMRSDLGRGETKILIPLLVVALLWMMFGRSPSDGRADGVQPVDGRIEPNGAEPRDAKTVSDLRRPLAVRYAVAGISLLCAGWFVVFASNEHVIANRSGARYFTVIMYAVIFLYGLVIARFLVASPESARRAAIVACVVLLGALLIRRPVALRDYRAFANATAVSAQPYRYYAGDYWQTWPLVLRDILDGHRSYGLGDRSVGNGAEISRLIADDIKANGTFTVLCVYATEQDCWAQATHKVSNPRVVGTKKVSEHAFEVTFAVQ